MLPLLVKSKAMPEQLYVVCDYRAVFDKSYMTPPGSVAFLFLKKCYSYG